QVATQPEKMRLVLQLLDAIHTDLLDDLEAQALWPEVRALSGKALRDKVRMSRSLHTQGFLEKLLDEGNVVESPGESEQIFYLALLVAGRLPEPEFSPEVKNDFCADCCAHLANARRRRAKWLTARDAL